LSELAIMRHQRDLPTVTYTILSDTGRTLSNPDRRDYSVDEGSQEEMAIPKEGSAHREVRLYSRPAIILRTVLTTLDGGD